MDQQRPVVSERDLILRAQAGDKPAFGELVQRYMRRAYFAALGFVGSPEDAMDLSQDAFARAYRARQKINPDMQFYTWFYQILRRLCFNFIRDRKLHRAKLREQKSWIVDDAEYRSGQRSPQRNVEREETRRRVRQAIETLPDREREVLVLKEFEGLKYREIADIVGIPIGTVMSRLYSARRNLAAAIEEMEP
ncbi:MAG: sigma-70 family RNA polymerase sigma factor [Acidobacteria bacterium]|nr:sigma-70 family RNA polymerase sigma factor [Acidobacteriota bacterium]NIM60179.1 sigma-70 family RNA polymerase sigma factor [Acidobacteriota bacterium]NIO57848.1 sigma-70 family RNA polymerase sigma factor [Acidobacteriota bacterium]NIQ28857.1 sigma-70 family RNA polymerase sigma factor [Acidobacteriota bacterium]NIQ83315.1 sigma-70 family RNA polymerase sigma factor [Acidobacteriota bacterium]